jgi:hypothetical protein
LILNLIHIFKEMMRIKVLLHYIING